MTRASVAVTLFSRLLLLINFSGSFFVPPLPQRCLLGLSVLPLPLQLLPLLLRLATLLQATFLLLFLKITGPVGRVSLRQVIVKTFMCEGFNEELNLRALTSA